jgi:glycosyltransferase involved in cell wall biosynthesis
MNAVILSYRISGNDGVSLECIHWKEILTKMGFNVGLIAGDLDRAGIVIPELDFRHLSVASLHDRVVYGREGYSRIEKEIFSLAGRIEGEMRAVFNNSRKPDLLILANILSLPMHFSLSVAVTRIIEELKIPTIARHHDFWWERKRYLKSTMFPFFQRFFPPASPLIRHVVINSLAKDELKKRTGINSTVIWDSFDFEREISLDSFAKKWREDFEIDANDIVFLQATRIVARKRIEVAIDLVKKLNDKRVVLVVAGKDGDEAGDYYEFVRRYAKKSGIRCRFIGSRVDSRRRMVANNGGRRRIYTLWDCYLNSDFVVYPTTIEGFGNQFVEAIYFRKPIVMTSYPVFETDIKPLGFQVFLFHPEVTKKDARGVADIISNPQKAQDVANYNFETGKKYFSYSWVEERIKQLILEFFPGWKVNKKELF